MSKINFLIPLMLFLWSCQSQNQGQDQDQQNEIVQDTISPAEAKTPNLTSMMDSFPYNLTQPTATFKLAKKLTEISGLSISKDQQHILAVNDEKGIIFYLNPNSGDIEKEINFRKDGDYEGIEVVNDSVYVVKNTGTVHEIQLLGADTLKTTKFNTILNSDNDVEGLTYNPDKHQLLLACKRKAGKGVKFQGTRAIYAFDLATKQLIEEPLYVIDRKIISAYLNRKGAAEKLIRILAPDQSDSAFGPSGIAIHPISKNIYLIASVGKLLLVLHPDGHILHIQKLDSGIFKQPEGICFTNDGTLFISTEGKGGKARLFRFD